MVRMLIVDYSHIPSLGLPSKLQFGIEVLRIIFFFSCANINLNRKSVHVCNRGFRESKSELCVSLTRAFEGSIWNYFTPTDGNGKDAM